MKIRKAFVANSSSSSFVCIISKTGYDELINEVHPYIKHVLNEHLNSSTTEVMGQVCELGMGIYYTEESYYLEEYHGDTVLDHDGKEIPFTQSDNDWEVYNQVMDPIRVMRHMVKLVQELGEHAFFQEGGG